MTVVTRIAPSPTGSMHIGTARTALFNLLYARHTGGTFLLRIEDTDRERSTEANVQVILDGLAWLELEPDAPPVFQATRAPRHVEVVQEMIARRAAYRDWTTTEDLEIEREKARAEGRVVRSVWRDRNEDGPADKPFAVRLRAPQTGETVIADLVKGEVVFKNSELDDLVLLRSDGTPTYNLAVVVDDHDMGVTHVIRGDDHLNNAARQTLIYQAMGWTRSSVRPPAADPRAGRGQAFQEARGASGGRVRRHGLSARGAAQLSGAARMGARRRRDLHRRGGRRSGSTSA